MCGVLFSANHIVWQSGLHGAGLNDIAQLPFRVAYLYISFFQVASIYRDPSIGNFINIVVVKIDVFRSEQVNTIIYYLIT